jgi:hypothetical protein
METMSQFTEPVIPDERRFAGRDPWFDRLTTLSEVEGESSESDGLRHSFWREGIIPVGTNCRNS